MEYRKLGASDLMVSEIGLGSWLTYGVGVESATARDSLDRAFELGVNCRPEQVDENVAASGIALDAATLAAIDEAVAGVVEY